MAHHYSREEQKTLLFFPLGTIGRDACGMLFHSMVLTYIMYTKDLSVAQFSAISIIMVLARVFDALNDPVMGNIVDRTNTKFGRFKPWFAAGIILTAIVVLLTFSSPLQGWNFVIFFAAIYLVFTITYTMHDVSYWGLLSNISSKQDMRASLTSRVTICTGIGGVYATVLVPFFVAGDHVIGGSAVNAYRILAIIACIMAPAFMIFPLLFVKERPAAHLFPVKDEPNADEGTGKAAASANTHERHTIKDVFDTIKNNDQLRWAAVAYLLQQTGNLLITSGLAVTYIYLRYGYNGTYTSLFTVIGFVGTFLFVLLYPSLSRKHSRRSLMKFGVTTAVVGYLLMLLTGIVFSGGLLGYIFFAASFLVANAGSYLVCLVLMICIPNTIEYNQYRFGERKGATISSVRSFMQKLSTALVSLLTTGSYLALGITKYTSRISDFENQAASGKISSASRAASITNVLKGIPSGKALGLLVIMTIVPLIVHLVCYVLFTHKYIIDETMYENMLSAIEDGSAPGLAGAGGSNAGGSGAGGSGAGGSSAGGSSAGGSSAGGSSTGGSSSDPVSSTAT